MMSLKDRDKRLHLAVGFGITCLVGLIHPALGAAACAAAAWGKEWRDAADPAHHTTDGWDAYATTLGIPLGLVALEILPRLLALLPPLP